jgi:hypothetical protein
MNHINLKLSVTAFNTLMTGLQELPFRVANPVFQEIMPQVEEQKKQALAPTESNQSGE